MNRPFKLWVAAAFTWAIFIAAFMQFLGFWAETPAAENMRIFAQLWGIPAFVVLAIGAVFRWALK